MRVDLKALWVIAKTWLTAGAVDGSLSVRFGLINTDQQFEIAAFVGFFNKPYY